MGKSITDQEWLEKPQHCSWCGQDKPITSFRYKIFSPEELAKCKTKKRRRRDRFCLECEPLYNRSPKRMQYAIDYNRKLRENTGERGRYHILMKILVGVRKRCRTHSLPYDLSTDYLMSLWDSQNGCCYYTGVPLSWGVTTHQPDSASVDRLEPDRGYVRGNVALCTLKMNVTKSNRTEEELYQLCQLVLDINSSRGR